MWDSYLHKAVWLSLCLNIFKILELIHQATTQFKSNCLIQPITNPINQGLNKPRPDAIEDQSNKVLIEPRIDPTKH